MKRGTATNCGKERKGAIALDIVREAKRERTFPDLAANREARVRMWQEHYDRLGGWDGQINMSPTGKPVGRPKSRRKVDA